MKCLLTAVNAKYIHSNPAVYTLKACAAEIPGVQVEIGEYTINHRADEILDSIYMKKADMVCFSCYIWNIEYVKTLVRDLRLLCPGLLIWLGGPEVSFHCEELLEELPKRTGFFTGRGRRAFRRFFAIISGRNRGRRAAYTGRGEESEELPRRP